jgi:vancomycin permeability regulator SanA
MFLFKIARRIISFLVLIVIIVPLYVAMSIWWSAHHVGPRPSDAIVILGAAEDNGTPTQLLAERITQAKLAYESGIAPVIITVGGGQKGDRFTEASASYRTLLGAGFTKSHLVELPVGTDTLSSTIAYVSYMKLRHWSSVVITTDPYHCYRAVAEASDLGVKATCNPVQAGPGSLGATGIRYIVRETGAYLAYKTVGQFGIHLSDQIKK